MTKVNFHALDKLGVKPMGIYGSKTEIVRFLLTANIINKPTWVLVGSCAPVALIISS